MVSVQGIGTHSWNPGCTEYCMLLSAGPYLDYCQPLTLLPSPGLPGLDHLRLQCSKWKGTWPAPFSLSLLLEGPALPRSFASAVSCTSLALRAAQWDPWGQGTPSREGLHLSRQCDRNDETWNRDDPKPLSLHGHRIPRNSLETSAAVLHYLTWHRPIAGPAPLWIINKPSPAAPFTAAPFTEFSFLAPKCLTQARHRQKWVKKTLYESASADNMASSQSNSRQICPISALVVGKLVLLATRVPVCPLLLRSTDIPVPLFMESSLFWSLQWDLT